jgi:hypothetical protein
LAADFGIIRLKPTPLPIYETILRAGNALLPQLQQWYGSKENERRPELILSVDDAVVSPIFSISHDLCVVGPRDDKDLVHQPLDPLLKRRSWRQRVIGKEKPFLGQSFGG